MFDLTAILLCGGKGERLKPFTESLPKALVPLNGHPLLHYLMKYLAEAGVSRFIVCVGYKAEAIERFAQSCCQSQWSVTCVNSGDVSMTDRILDARRHFDGPALICYGDTLANIDLAALWREHQASGALATLTVFPLHSPFGIVSFDEAKRITAFVEKPRLPYWINIGYLLCEPAAFDYLKPQSDMPDFLSALSRAGALSVFLHQGKHITVNTEKERSEAETDVIEFLTLMDEQRI
jgi:glucose-1-phosphate cytidylyltransferase